MKHYIKGDNIYGLAIAFTIQETLENYTTAFSAQTLSKDLLGGKASSL